MLRLASALSVSGPRERFSAEAQHVQRALREALAYDAVTTFEPSVPLPEGA